MTISLEKRAATTQVSLIVVADQPIFWQFVGIGYSPASPKELDTMLGRKVDFSSTCDMEDTAFFGEITREYLTSWLPEAQRLGITGK